MSITHAESLLKSAFAPIFQLDQKCSADGALGKVHYFGHEWVEKRERFVASGFDGVIGVVHGFTSALFHSMWALTAGKAFTNKECRTFAAQAWKDTGHDLVVIFKSLIGIVSPTAAEWVDQRMLQVGAAQNLSDQTTVVFDRVSSNSGESSLNKSSKEDSFSSVGSIDSEVEKNPPAEIKKDSISQTYSEDEKTSEGKKLLVVGVTDGNALVLDDAPVDTGKNKLDNYPSTTSSSFDDEKK